MERSALSIERVAIDTLFLDPANVRTHSKANLEAIKGSLARFGQQKPLVVSGAGVVLAGNGTLTAARELGWTHITIARTELNGVDATAFALADNRTAELAGWDIPSLAEVTSALAVDGFDVQSIGFSVDFLGSITEAPTFDPTGPDAAPRLDEKKETAKKQVKCPSCSHEFTP